jgi:hypothetical protein
MQRKSYGLYFCDDTVYQIFPCFEILIYVFLQCDIFNTQVLKEKKPWPQSAGELYRLSDCRLSPFKTQSFHYAMAALSQILTCFVFTRLRFYL